MGPQVFTSCRSADPATAVLAEDVLLAGLGSVSLAVMLAVLVMVDGVTKPGGTFAVMVNDILKPFAKVPRLQVTGDPEQEIELILNVVPAGSGSVTTTLVALFGPKLVALMV